MYMLCLDEMQAAISRADVAPRLDRIYRFRVAPGGAGDPHGSWTFDIWTTGVAPTGVTARKWARSIKVVENGVLYLIPPGTFRRATAPLTDYRIGYTDILDR
jgi:hypothetical protein